MHTYGDACEMTEMTKSPLSGVGGVVKKIEGQGVKILFNSF